MEFSLQFGSERGWIPIILTILRGRTGNAEAMIPIGTTDTEGNILIRGYLPELKVASFGDNTPRSVTVCAFEDSVDSVQFRWLQTIISTGNHQVLDAWTLDNVLITYQDGRNETSVLFDSSK